ncbi:hypothetical protein [Actinomycetospora sp. TBRC 11914]|uniref:hypothetical protein n=1 Tax=Actinomycetospora sp. TBRC 11914 TaxID=2729387 RepID=UPI00145D51BC|nr:hypothetical protein [Actinomycetospora sp. TBRC 11914]NMO92507.1 hypothetical protein [Actinomycetospora sp. TBRC 11914]
MFRSTARRATPQPSPSADRAARGRHHRAVRDRETRDRQEALRRARRRTSQVDAYEAVSGPLPTATAAQRSTPTRPEPLGPPRIDNTVARRDPLTAPFPAAPHLPGARRAPDGPLRVPARAV